MAKRSRARTSRSNGAVPTPTTVRSGYTTPSSSAYPSSYPSEDEGDVQPAKFDISTIPIHKLSLQDADFTPKKAEFTAVSVPGKSGDGSEAAAVKGKEPAKPVKPFRFLDLPTELRLKIYAYHFEDADPVLDLTPENFKKVYRKLFLLRTCRQIYLEASHLFYSTHNIRVFPTYPGRFFKTRRPLLARLSQRQRQCLTGLELRLGPGFNKPPKCWAVNKALGLKDCAGVRRLLVFVQLDPSVSWLDGFRKPGFYEAFSSALLDDILKEMPAVDVVEFDAYESVRKNCPIMQALLQVTVQHGKRIAWGPKNGWADADSGGTDSEARPVLAPALSKYDGPIVAVA